MTLYDEYLYDEFPVTDTHPARIGAIATLFGLRPAPPDRCRVLELGCGLGGNLVPMASDLPGSRLLGVDLASRQIAMGRDEVTALGLSNLDLRAASILDVDASFGTFDYIICHGVFSWVEDDVQDKILAICGEQLAPDGVAFLSFNTYPGWHLRGMLRDMLRREVDPEAAPPERVAQARAFLDFLRHTPERNPAQAFLVAELDLLTRLSDKYLFFEYLVDRNEPIYFEDFAARAARAGLSYIADAHFPSTNPARLGVDAAAAIAERSNGLLATERAIDQLEIRFFRRALLCRTGAKLDRDVSWERLRGLRVVSRFAPSSHAPDVASAEPETFERARGGELTTSLPILKAALVLLAERGPRGVPFEELAVDARLRVDDGAATIEDRAALGGNLLALYLQGQIDLVTWAREAALVPGDRPSTTALVRRQASRERDSVTNFRHESIMVDRFDRVLLRRLDGSFDRDELVRGIFDDLEAGRLSVELNGEPCIDPEVILEVVEKKLARFAELSLLVT